MAYTTAVKASRMEVVRSALNAGANPGMIRIYDSGDTMLVEIDMTTDCGTVGGTDTLTLDCDPALEGAAVADGTASYAQLWSGEATPVLVRDEVTVGTSGTQLVLSSLVVTTGDTVQVTSGVIQHG